MLNAKILNVLRALTANGGGNILKFLNGIMIIRSDTIALNTTFPTPFIGIPTVLLFTISTRATSSYDRELYPTAVNPTGFSAGCIELNDRGVTKHYGYLAIGRWK